VSQPNIDWFGCWKNLIGRKHRNSVQSLGDYNDIRAG
jgi:hypothetical protein